MNVWRIKLLVIQVLYKIFNLKGLRKIMAGNNCGFNGKGFSDASQINYVAVKL